MNNKKNIFAIYFSGFLQGIALILYPAAGTIFTSADYHNLSSSEFGLLFTPQIIFVILASVSAPKLAAKYGMKKVLIWGLMANFLSMILFAASSVCIGTSSLPFWVLMLGTGMLGAGFGFTITALNPFAYHLFPGKEASAVTGMHIFLGLGTTAAALILNAFKSAEIWWGSGLVVAIPILLMIVFQWTLTLELPKEEDTNEDTGKKKIPLRIWLYAGIIFLYGFSEATFGNWAPIFLEKEAGFSAARAAIGLSVFWASITVGRLLFTFIALRFNTKKLYLLSPFLVALVFFFIPELKGDFAPLAAMALGGIGLSFFFPNTISIATDEYPAYAAIISGALVAAIQVGTGISANVIGALSESFSLGFVFQLSAIYGLITGILGLYLHFSQKN